MAPDGRRSRRALPLLMALAAGCALGPTTGAQDVTFKANVNLVNVFVNVTDQNGAIVGGLTRDDFKVA